MELGNARSAENNAYLYSALATAVITAGGYGLYRALPERRSFIRSYSQKDLGLLVMASGVLIGPGVGNLTIGAGTDFGYGVKFRAVTLTGAAALWYGGVVAAYGGAEPVALVLLLGSAGVAGYGLIGGVWHDISTIPRNARASQRRQRDGVAVAPPEVSLGYSVEASAPVLTFRMGL